MIKIKVINYYKPSDSYIDTLVLGRDSWNDYGYYTLFTVNYFDSDSVQNEIGSIKIYTTKLDEENAIRETYDYLDKEIENLGDTFCSLGQSINYYHKLMEVFPESYKSILNRLKDCAYDNSLYEKYKDYLGVQNSLLRESSANKALIELPRVIAGTITEVDLSFTYKAEVPFSTETTNIKFNFAESKYFPYRINALVGKNGTGKTYILTDMANKISGFTKQHKNFNNSFIEERPRFEKIISISYSAFDKFKKKRSGDSLYSYVYCGIQSEEGPLTLKELRENFKSSLNTVKKNDRYSDWKKIVSELMEEEHQEILQQIEKEKIDEIRWSSGQHILISTVTEILAHIEKDSILLFDEPEIHLHPNAMANVMRMFNKLLELYDSYAIFATHSPIILQELSSKNIVILNRMDNILISRKPEIECFGENISNITSEVFDVSPSESSYKSILQKASEYLTEEEIFNEFDNELSLNAKVYLKSLFHQKGRY